MDPLKKVYLRLPVYSYFWRVQPAFNTSYLTDSSIGFTLKMESVSKNDGEKWSRKKSF